MPLTTQQIATLVGGELAGPSGLTVTAMGSLDAAGPDHLTFISDARYAERWPTSRAGAALAPRGLHLPPNDGRAVIRVGDVDAAVSAVLTVMAPPAVGPETGVHRSSVVEPSAEIGRDAR